MKPGRTSCGQRSYRERDARRVLKEHLSHLRAQEASTQNSIARTKAALEKSKGLLLWISKATFETMKEQGLTDMHARWIRIHWGDAAHSCEAHLKLSQMYLVDDRFRTYYDSAAGVGATNFLVAALQSNL